MPNTIPIPTLLCFYCACDKGLKPNNFTTYVEGTCAECKNPRYVAKFYLDPKDGS